jgi:hypothetical protein
MKMQNNHTQNWKGSGCWLQRFVRCHGRIIKNLLDINVLESCAAQLVALCSQGCERSACFPMGNSIHAPSFALASPNSSQQRTPHKRILAWKDGNTLAIARLNDTHPENGGGASGHPPTPAQPSESSEQREYKDSKQLQLMQWNLRIIANIGWMIFGYLVWREVNPTMSLWLLIPILSLQATLLSSLLPIFANRLEHLWLSDSCDARMTPNV